MVNPAPDVAVLLQQGLTLHQQGRLDEARARYAQVLQWAPENADAWHLLGVVLGALGQTAQGIEHLQRAIALRPDFAAAHNNLGNAYRATEQSDAAIAAYRAALAVRPDYPVALNNLGCVLKARDQLQEAADVLRRALQLDPDYVEAWYNLGNTCVALGDHEAALAAYQTGLAHQPDDVELLLALATTHHRHGQAGQALAVATRVLALAPQWAQAHNALGAIRERQGELEAARAAYRQAVDLAPDLADAQFNLGAVELCLGNFSAGWQGYAYRPPQSGVPDPLAFAARVAKYRGQARSYIADLHAGAGLPAIGSNPRPAASKPAILLYAEQGFGDTLQFARYAPLLVEAGATVGLVVPPPLRSLLAASLPTVSVFSQGETLPAADEHCPLMSLPLVFGTTLTTIPAPTVYLQAPPERVSRWASRLPGAGSRRVGVAWSGKQVGFEIDRRRVPLACFSMLLQGTGGVFFGLQTEIQPADRSIMPDLGNFIDLSAQIGDWSDTASIMANLDLIVTVDTSIAHLAGAMGKPVWVLLPFAADWRWLLDRADSPWYPGMRLFRQSSPGDWAGVLRRVADALRHDCDTV